MSGFSRGVLARRCYNDEVAPNITKNDFYDNVYGIKLYGIAEGESQVIITENHFEELTDDTTAYGIYAYISSIYVKGNTFVNIGVLVPDFWTYYSAIADVGSTSTPGWNDVKRSVIEENVFVQHTSAPAVMGYFSDFLVKNNDITSDGTAIWIKGGTGYDPSQGAYSEWTIVDNTINGSGNSGIYATGGGYGQTAISATGNTITGFDNGIRLVNDGNIVAKATINYNNIYGNASYGITNVAANALADATNNWWDYASGPYDPDGDTEVPPCNDVPADDMNLSGLGDNVSHNVDYCPWLEEPCSPVIEVTIDIKPGSEPNSINPKSKGKIPVAILSTADFDATQEVDKESLTFGKTGDEDCLSFCTKSDEDVNVEGLDDVVCHFNTQDTDFEDGDTEGILKGQTVDGVPIEGRDSVRIVPKAKK
jgi:hypothetical protein